MTARVLELPLFSRLLALLSRKRPLSHFMPHSILHALPQPLFHRSSRALLLLLLLLTSFSPLTTYAADTGSYKDPAPAFPLPPVGNKISPVQILRVDFGFDKALVPEKFMPITVWLASHNNSYSGLLTLNFKQDGTQNTTYVLPVSTTPGQVVPFELLAALPNQIDEITVTLQSNQPDAKVVFSNRRGRGDESLPQRRTENPFILLIDLPPLAASSLKPASTIHPTTPTPPTPPTPPAPPALPASSLTGDPQSDENLPNLWDDFSSTPITIDRLPRSWIAYDSCTFAIIPASSLPRADPQAFEALLTWVRSGGRLLVIADTPGSDWTRIFPSETALPLTLGEVQAVKPLFESEIKAAHIRGVKKSRPIHLTEHASITGWYGLWPIEPSIPQQPNSSAPSSSQSAWLSAIGPVGLGVVSIVTTDPIYTSEVVDLKKIQQAYITLLEPLLPSHTRQELLSRDRDGFTIWSIRYGDPDPLGKSAFDQSVTLLSPVPVFGIGAFTAIIVLMALLTLFVGLIAGLIRKKITHSIHSWYLAAAAIIATSLLSYVAPTFMRSGESIISRVTLLDATPDPDGFLQGGPVNEICGFFGGKPGNIKLIGDEPGAWWRGVSSLEFRSSRSSPFSDLTLPINYAPGALANSFPIQVNQSQWTYRLTSRAVPFDPLTTPLQLQAHYKSNNQIEITLNGLPPQTTIKDIYAKLKGQRLFTKTVNQVSQGSATLLIDTVEDKVLTPSDELTKSAGITEPTTNPSHLAQFFPIARGRSDALDMKLNNSDSILLVITCEGNFTPLNMMPVEPFRSVQTIQLRVVAPLAPFSSASPANPNTQSK